jgi:hypothetical protein
MTRRHAVHAVAIALGVLWALLALAPPAAAHGGDGSEQASDFRAFFVDGAAACLQWKLLATDGYLELRSECPGTVTVLGYEDEPYLEFSAEGVRENQNSPATYLNRDRNANVAVPEHARPDAPPDWQPRSSLPVYRWHDHRTHWMNSAPPDTGRDRGSVRVSQWAIALELDDDGTGAFRYRLDARGELWYSPPLPWWIPIGLAALPTGVVLGVALLRRDDPEDGGVAPGRALARPVAALLGSVVVLTTIAAIDDIARGGQSAGQRITAVLIAGAVLSASGWATWRARRGDDGSFLALVGAAVAIGWAFGVQHRPTLTRSQLQTALPDLLLRVTVGLQLLIIVPAVVVLAVARWRARDGGAAGSPGAGGAARVAGSADTPAGAADTPAGAARPTSTDPS